MGLPTPVVTFEPVLHRVPPPGAFGLLLLGKRLHDRTEGHLQLLDVLSIHGKRYRRLADVDAQLLACGSKATAFGMHLYWGASSQDPKPASLQQPGIAAQVAAEAPRLADRDAPAGRDTLGGQMAKAVMFRQRS
jgi:hypothetical protein